MSIEIVASVLSTVKEFPKKTRCSAESSRHGPDLSQFPSNRIVELLQKDVVNEFSSHQMSQPTGDRV
jgi:hypothetical protein